MKKKRYITLACVSIALAVSVAGAAVSIGSAFSPSVVRAETATVENVELNDYYVLGDVAEMPSNATVKNQNGDEGVGEFKAIITPDGRSVSSKKIELTGVGKYSAVYVATINGKQYTAKKEFVVTEKKWSVGSSASKVEYSENLTAKRYGGKGLNVTLAAGDKFTFASPINLSKNGLTDVITMYSTAMQAKGDSAWNNNNKAKIDSGELTARNFAYEAGLIEVTLTDCYDPSISLTLVNYISTLNGEGAYARTRASLQGEFGLYENCPPRFGKRDVYIDGTRYGIYVGDFGMSVTGSTDNKALCWSVNAVDGDVYYNWYGSTGKREGKYLINQLYNEEISGGAVFPGFTTGEVYLSVSADENYTNSTTFHIESIGDYIGEALKEGVCEDNVAPQIVVDGDGGFVKTGDEFVIPSATVYDVNSVGEITEKVYFNYGTSAQSSVAVENGRFVPKTAGRYVVEYSSVDAFGNKGVATIDVNAVVAAPATLTVEKIASMKAGEKVVLPEYRATSLNGEVSVDVVARKGDKTFEIKDGSFIPTSVGRYDIIYVYADKLKTYEYSYSVNCEANDGKAFVTAPVFEDYYIKGLAYTLPYAEAYEFVGEEPSLYAHEIYASFDKGEFVKVSSANEFEISGNTSVKFKYVADNAVIISDEIPVIDVGYGKNIDMAKYFTGNFTANKDYSSIEFVSNAVSGRNELKYIGSLCYSVFSMNWSVPENKANVGSYSIVLSDKNANEYVFRFYKAGGTSYLSFNGGEGKKLSEDIFGGGSYELSFDYENEAFKLSAPNQTISLPAEEDLSYEKASVKVIFEEIKGVAAIKITSLQNQLLNNGNTDETQPLVYARRDIASAGIGAKDVIYSAVASDVLSSVLKGNVRVTVKSPSGADVVAKDGTVMKNAVADKDYEIEYNEYGVYIIRYTAEDASGNVAPQPYMVEIADDVAPTVRFKDGSNENTVQNIRVGYKYKVKEFVAEDNVCQREELSVVIFIYDDCGVIVKYNVEEFTMTEERDYVVYVYVTDKSGNSSYASYKLHAVKE